jgi:hypothetical protein
MTAARKRWHPPAALSRWRSIARRWFLLAVGLLLVGGGSVFLIGDIAATMGYGAHGYFVAQDQHCITRVGCHWDGTFVRADGTVVRQHVQYAGGYFGLDVGSRVPAIYERTSDYAYPPHSMHWFEDALAMAFGALLVGQSLITRRGSRVFDHIRERLGA